MPHVVHSLDQRSANLPLTTTSARCPGASVETSPASNAAVPEPVMV